MLGILFSALVLMGVLFLVARNDAEISFPRMLLVSLGITVVALVSSPLGLLALPIVLVASAWILVRFCYVSWTQAWIVTGIYLVVQIALGVGWALLTRSGG
jgi:hypothetical protein